MKAVQKLGDHPFTVKDWEDIARVLESTGYERRPQEICAQLKATKSSRSCDILFPGSVSIDLTTENGGTESPRASISNKPRVTTGSLPPRLSEPDTPGPNIDGLSLLSPQLSTVSAPSDKPPRQLTPAELQQIEDLNLEIQMSEALLLRLDKEKDTEQAKLDRLNAEQLSEKQEKSQFDKGFMNIGRERWALVGQLREYEREENVLNTAKVKVQRTLADINAEIEAVEDAFDEMELWSLGS